MSTQFEENDTSLPQAVASVNGSSSNFFWPRNPPLFFFFFFLDIDISTAGVKYWQKHSNSKYKKDKLNSDFQYTTYLTKLMPSPNFGLKQFPFFLNSRPKTATENSKQRQPTFNIFGFVTIWLVTWHMHAITWWRFVQVTLYYGTP